VVLQGPSVPDASIQISWFILALTLVPEFHFFFKWVAGSHFSFSQFVYKHCQAIIQ
jgi:hypothetical protein